MAGVVALLAVTAVADLDRPPLGEARSVAATAPDDPATVQTVTLRLRVTGVRVGTGARVTIAGTLRGHAEAGRRTYRLEPVGDGATAIHRHGTAAAQRARVDEVLLDVRSGSDFVSLAGTGSLTGGPPISGPGGVCRRIAFHYTADVTARTAVLRWACRRAGAERSSPIHRDGFRLPRDTIASSHAITRRPCSPRQAVGRRRSTTEVRGAC